MLNTQGNLNLGPYSDLYDLIVPKVPYLIATIAKTAPLNIAGIACFMFPCIRPNVTAENATASPFPYGANSFKHSPR